MPRKKNTAKQPSGAGKSNSPKPGDKGYRGPVSEGWGRKGQSAITSIDQHVRNAAGIPGDINKNVSKAVGDAESALRNALDWGKADRQKAAAKKAAVSKQRAAAMAARAKAKGSKMESVNKMQVGPKTAVIRKRLNKAKKTKPSKGSKKSK